MLSRGAGWIVTVLALGTTLAATFVAEGQLLTPRRRMAVYATAGSFALLTIVVVALRFVTYAR